MRAHEIDKLNEGWWDDFTAKRQQKKAERKEKKIAKLKQEITKAIVSIIPQFVEAIKDHQYKDSVILWSNLSDVIFQIDWSEFISDNNNLINLERNITRVFDDIRYSDEPERVGWSQQILINNKDYLIKNILQIKAELETIHNELKSFDQSPTQRQEPVKQQPKPQSQAPKVEPVKQQPKAQPKPQAQRQEPAKPQPKSQPKAEPVKQQPKPQSTGRFAFNPLGR